ncbi:MAG TPA: DUF262 domain-containing protein [Opitutaceae bacterium]|nr:DUF262 domain-containing protein [Opitutaceae bacterium]
MTDEFSLGKYPQSSALVVYSEKDAIQLNPDYQRISGIWTLEKRQLLIDSLINGFDVPKLYFHEFVPPKKVGSKKYRYAIIDGKQRIQTIWDFIEGNISLSEEFEYIRDSTIKAAGLGYSQLAEKYPQLKSRFDATPLDIVTIRTSDLDLIEDMFSRLNEAVPLNAPEKRNAFGGPMPNAIQKVSGHKFFAKHIPFPDNRYRHRDLAAKFIFIEHENEIANTKKAVLDQFVRQFKKWRQEGLAKASQAKISMLVSETEKTLSLMTSIFGTPDKLLRQVGMITLYFYLFRFIKSKKVDTVSRDMLAFLEKSREKNRLIAEEQGETSNRIDLALLEFDKHSQTPNDAYAIRIRLGILLKFLSKHFNVNYDASILREPK